MKFWSFISFSIFGFPCLFVDVTVLLVFFSCFLLFTWIYFMPLFQFTGWLLALPLYFFFLSLGSKLSILNFHSVLGIRSMCPSFTGLSLHYSSYMDYTFLPYHKMLYILLHNVSWTASKKKKKKSVTVLIYLLFMCFFIPF
jgi:hypothetical protein